MHELEKNWTFTKRETMNKQTKEFVIIRDNESLYKSSKKLKRRKIKASSSSS